MPTPGKPPCVSIGLPVYNGEKYLESAIASLLEQTFEDFELIISDNASTDRTPEICTSLADWDSRIRYYRQETNLGAARNYNLLLEASRGTFFKWAAHDDECYPRLLAECVRALERRPAAVLAYPQTHMIDDTGSVLSTYSDNLHLSQATPHERLVAYLRKNFIRRHGLCNPIFGVIRISELRRSRLIQDFIGSDLALLAHLALLGEFVEVPEVLFRRRVHQEISTIANTSFADRLAWFNPASRRGQSSRFNNYLKLRAIHLHNYHQAIGELVDDERERRRCRIELAKLVCSDVKWLYKDVKYTLGFRPTPGPTDFMPTQP